MTQVRRVPCSAALAIAGGLVFVAATASAQVQVTGDLDHLTCYKIRDPLKLKGLGVDGAKPFATLRHIPFDDPEADPLSQDCKFTKGALLCARSTKRVCSGGERDGKACVAATDCPDGTCNDGQDAIGEALQNDFICYKVRCTGALPPKAGAIDQFGSRPVEGVEAVRTSYVCAPVATSKPSCGNGALDTNEQCDPGNPDAEPPIPAVGGPNCSATDCEEDCSCSETVCNGLMVTIGGTSAADGGRCLAGVCGPGSSMPSACDEDCDCALRGTTGNDVIHGRGGDDVICGLDGNDTICGGLGKDVLFGGNGDDDIFGETGNDTICGEAGNNTLRGGSGDDFLFGGADLDNIKGEGGTNVICAGDGGDIADGGDGDDVVCGEDCNMVPCSATAPPIPTCICDNDSGGDVLSGGLGDDVVHGCSGTDIIFGDAGTDTLFGDTGSPDTCDGGAPETDDICDSSCESTPQCP